ncbi:hypothetical protein [Krasilnikovia sp. MM14-A1004]|uniref:hypothetical protein n=1 Tax=Krasilnikovia sp. MM14-A1004 TaxID=3373541 RepID=UPI00399CE70F
MFDETQKVVDKARSSSPTRINAATPFEIMDYAGGLVGVTPSATMIYAGLDRSGVLLGTTTYNARPHSA